MKYSLSRFMSPCTSESVENRAAAPSLWAELDSVILYQRKGMGSIPIAVARVTV